MGRAVAAVIVVVLVAVTAVLASAGAGRSGASGAEIVSPPALTVAAWTPATDNLVVVKGKVEVGGAPVAGAHVRVDGYAVPAPTDAAGTFSALVDDTLLGRHVVTVADAAKATHAGRALTSSEQADVAASEGAIEVAYAIRGLTVSRDSNGQPVLSGQLAAASGAAPPPVALLTYRLTGTVTDGNGHPVAGAQVSTRTLDRDYWTVSTTTDDQGRYTSLFAASAEAPGNPVPYTVRVSKGDAVYQFLPTEYVYFDRLESARLDLRLPPAGYAMAIPQSQSYKGAVYTGVLVGVTVNGAPVKPISATWPDRAGRFRLTLPRRLAGETVSLWEAKSDLFSRTAAAPGSAVDLGSWPATLPPDAPTDLASVRLHG